MEYREFPNAYFSENSGKNPPTKEELQRKLTPFRRHLVAFITALPQNARILDAGCGSGKVSYMVKTLRPDIEIHAMDISDVGSLLPDWIKFKKGSVEDVAKLYPADHFDAIICLHVIEHLVYPMDMIIAFRTILKKGGRVFFETPNWTRLFIPFSPMFFWNDYTHIRPFSPFSINKLLLEFDFSPEKIISCSSNTFFVKDSVSVFDKIKTVTDKKPKVYVVKSKSRIFEMAKSLFRRAVSPFLRDILVAIAVKN